MNDSHWLALGDIRFLRLHTQNGLRLSNVNVFTFITDKMDMLANKRRSLMHLLSLPHPNILIDSGVTHDDASNCQQDYGRRNSHLQYENGQKALCMLRRCMRIITPIWSA